MKSIKLKLVLWITILLGIVGTCIAEDTLPPWGKIQPETTIIQFAPLTIESNPLDFTLKREPLEDNAPLQSMLECQNEQTDALNENLSALNRTAEDYLTYKKNEKQSTLNSYNIVPNNIQEDYTMWTIIGYALALICVIGMYFVYELHKYLYWTKKRTTPFLISLGLGLFVIYIFIKIMHLTIPGYYLWVNVDKLF